MSTGIPPLERGFPLSAGVPPAPEPSNAPRYEGVSFQHSEQALDAMLARAPGRVAEIITRCNWVLLGSFGRYAANQAAVHGERWQAAAPSGAAAANLGRLERADWYVDRTRHAQLEHLAAWIERRLEARWDWGADPNHGVQEVRAWAHLRGRTALAEAYRNHAGSHHPEAFHALQTAIYGVEVDDLLQTFYDAVLAFERLMLTRGADEEALRDGDHWCACHEQLDVALLTYELLDRYAPPGGRTLPLGVVGAHSADVLPAYVDLSNWVVCAKARIDFVRHGDVYAPLLRPAASLISRMPEWTPPASPQEMQAAGRVLRVVQAAAAAAHGLRAALLTAHAGTHATDSPLQELIAAATSTTELRPNAALGVREALDGAFIELRTADEALVGLRAEIEAALTLVEQVPRVRAGLGEAFDALPEVYEAAWEPSEAAQPIQRVVERVAAYAPFHVFGPDPEAWVEAAVARILAARSEDSPAGVTVKA